MNMNKLGKMKVPLVVAAQILTISLLAASAAVVPAVGAIVGTTAPLTACHVTGDPANPYVEITIVNMISARCRQTVVLPAQCKSAMARLRSAMPLAAKPILTLRA